VAQIISEFSRVKTLIISEFKNATQNCGLEETLPKIFYYCF
jgi:cytidine deaminase